MIQKQKIVIIDDDRDMRDALKMFLRANDYQGEIHEANNGATGLRLIEAVEPNLVFTDLKMPELNGDEVIKAVRLRRSSLELPIILITGEEEVTCPDGCNQLMEKPIDLDRFRAVVSQFVPLVLKTTTG